MNTTPFLEDNKSAPLEKKKTGSESAGMKEDVYIQINTFAFDLSFKSLNSNYKRKKQSRS